MKENITDALEIFLIPLPNPIIPSSSSGVDHCPNFDVYHSCACFAIFVICRFIHKQQEMSFCSFYAEYQWFPIAHFILQIAFLALHKGSRFTRVDNVALWFKLDAPKRATEWMFPDLVIGGPVDGCLYCFRDSVATHTAAMGTPVCGWKVLWGVDLDCHPGWRGCTCLALVETDIVLY